ncbi:MAG: hypothetical protein IJA68_00240 [Clostridia bacterium]|nr:hypothetical protein [Clostridia bacterium]
MKTWMKHAIVLVAAFAVLVMNVGVAVSAQTVNETTNESSTPRTALNMTDVLTAYQAVAGNNVITAYATALVDADFDGGLAMNDVLKVYQTVAGGNTEILPSVAYKARSVAAAGFDAVGSDNGPQLIKTAAEWRSFRAAFDEVPQSAYYPIGDLDFDNQALIAVPEMAEDLYVADVATDDDTLYVSLVSLAVPSTDPAERAAWLFIQIDHTAFEGKSDFEVVVYRENQATYEGVVNVTSKIVYYNLDYPFLPDIPCGCEDHVNLIFRSREECEAFVEAHQYPEAPLPIETITMDDFAAYDDAFFEEYMLVRTIYSAPSSGYEILPFAYFNASEDRLILHRHVIIPDDDDYVLLAHGTHVAYVPVPKSYDHGQPIELADYVQANYSYELL